jgi:hypothetical protein
LICEFCGKKEAEFECEVCGMPFCEDCGAYFFEPEEKYLCHFCASLLEEEEEIGESWCDRHNAPHYRALGAYPPPKGGTHQPPKEVR